MFLGLTERSATQLNGWACTLYQHDVFAGTRQSHESCVGALLRISVIGGSEAGSVPFTSMALTPLLSVEPITMMPSAGGILARPYQSSGLANRAGYLKGGCSEGRIN